MICNFFCKSFISYDSTIQFTLINLLYSFQHTSSYFNFIFNYSIYASQLYQFSLRTIQFTLISLLTHFLLLHNLLQFFLQLFNSLINSTLSKSHIIHSLFYTPSLSPPPLTYLYTLFQHSLHFFLQLFNSLISSTLSKSHIIHYLTISFTHPLSLLLLLIYTTLIFLQLFNSFIYSNFIKISNFQLWHFYVF